MNEFADHGIDAPADVYLLRRDESGVGTNVPHLVTHHSPTGFEFGYGGSGPADLALNILEHSLHRLGYTGERETCWRGDCFTHAFVMHQAFKWEFIAGAPAEGDVIITHAAVDAWIKAY